MKQVQVDQFFQLLDKRLNLRAKVILIGASAGSLMGHIRPSLDIDFEIRLQTSTPKNKQRLVEAIEEARAIVGVSVNYSENIAGWSLVSYLDYRKTAEPYKTIGKLSIQLIAPAYWTIGKMARYLELDNQDMVAVIRKKKILAPQLIKLWACAVRASDLSLELGQFKEHVLTFLKRNTRILWGSHTDADKLSASFLKEINKK